MLNRILNAACISACLMMIVVGGVFVDKQLAERRGRSFVPRPIAAGQTIKLPIPAGGKPTLLLELSPTCSHCIANEPLYRRLSAMPQIRSGKVHVIIAMANGDQKAAQAFVDRDGIPGFLVMVPATGEPPPFPFYSTPTILLVGPDGKINEVWIGELHGDAEEKLLAKLS